MIGDPDLHEDNRNEWTQLVHESLLSSKKLSPEICSQEALTCLKAISDKFEEVTVQSRFFQVSGLPPAKQRLLKLKRSHSKYKGCVCYANICVRMWSTADDDDPLSEEEGDEKKCVFHEESKHRRTLQWMANPHLDPQRALVYDMKKAILPMPDNDHQLSSGPGHATAINIAISPDIDSQRCSEDTPGSSTTEAQLRAPHSQPMNAHDRSMEMALNIVNSGENLSVIQNLKAAQMKKREETQSVIAGVMEVLVTKGAKGTEDCGTAPEADSNVIPGIIPTQSTAPLSNCDSGAIYDTQPSTTEDHGHGVKEIEDEKVSNSDQGSDANGVVDDYYPGDMNMSPTTPPRSRKLPLLLNLPLRPQRFIGREDVLQSLKSKFLTDETSLTQDDTMVMQRQLIAVVQGIGGIGKTTTVLEFVHRHGDHFDQIFWIQASNRLKIAQSLHEATVALGLIQGRSNHNHAESKVVLEAWFQTTVSKWLIVFDDADELGVIEPYLPLCNSGSIIVTSRRDNICYLHHPNRHVKTIPILPLTENESLEFLLDNTSFSGTMQGSEDATEVGKLLGGHPLSLSLAAAYITRGNQSLSTLRGNWFSLRSRLEGASTTHELSREVQLTRDNGSVLSTMLSLDYMSPKAYDLCSVMAILDPHEIQQSILLGAQTYEGVGVPLADFPLSDYNFAAAKDEVVSHQICWNKGPRSLSMHRIVQQTLRKSIKAQKLTEGFNTASLLLLAQWPSERKFKNIVLGNWPEFDQLHSHVHSLSEMFVDMSTDNGSSTVTVANSGVTSAFIKLLLRSTWYGPKISKI